MLSAHHTPVREVGSERKSLLGESNEVSDDESWARLAPDYMYADWARLVRNFYGPDTESIDDDKLVTWRIQIGLLQRNKPSRRGNCVKWNLDDEGDLLDQ
ncbi:hypothetical protein APSETT444_009342 [Aspergillus pseudonomiae]